MVSHDCIACELVSVSRHSVTIGMRYYPATPEIIPEVFLHGFAGHTRPQRTPRAPYTKNRFFFYTLTNLVVELHFWAHMHTVQ